MIGDARPMLPEMAAAFLAENGEGGSGQDRRARPTPPPGVVACDSVALPIAPARACV